MKSSVKIKEIVANRIILRSPTGQVRAWFDASSEGVISLNLFGPRASLSTGIDRDGNPKINLQNKRNRGAIAIVSVRAIIDGGGFLLNEGVDLSL